MLAAQSARALWYLSRGTGLVSLVLLTASVVLGITEVVRWASERWPRFVTAALHRNVSLLATAFIGVHIATAVVDGFAPIRWLDALVPFTSAYRPIWLGLGAVAVDLFLALIVTSLLRQRLGYRAWRAVHWAAYASWPLAVVHGLGTGSDSRVQWVQLLDVVALAAVVAAVWWRLANGSPAASGQRVAAAFASVVVPMAMIGWTMIGPARTGWARRAGTPASLLASSGGAQRATASGGQGATTSATLSPPFTASLSGTVVERDGADGRSTVTIDAALTQGATGTLNVVLRGEAIAGGGVQLDDSSVTLGTGDRPDLYTGRVTGLDGGRVVASLAGPDRRALVVSMRLDIDGATGAVTGTVRGTSA